MSRRDRDKLEQEPDRVPTRRITLIGVVGLLVFGGAALWSSRVQLGLSGTIHSNTAGRAEHAGEREVGMVYQRPFERENIAAARSAAARERLESVGWVDRERGVVHVPIEQAMEIIARRGKL
jgi:hypothetical protein